MKLKLSDAARRLGMTRQALAKRIKANKIKTSIDPISGWTVIDERELAKISQPKKRGQDGR